MPKTFVFFPRRKEGEDVEPGPLTRHITVNQETLEGLFHLPLKEAAREIGLCPTTFKKACRRFNLEQWPFRKGQSRAPSSRRNEKKTDAATKTLPPEPSCEPAALAALAAPATSAASTLLHTTHHQEKPYLAQPFCQVAPAFMPAWHDGAIAWRDTSAFCRSFNSNASSQATVRASSELDTRAWFERPAFPPFQPMTYAPPDAPLNQTYMSFLPLEPSFIDSSFARSCIYGGPGQVFGGAGQVRFEQLDTPKLGGVLGGGL